MLRKFSMFAAVLLFSLALVACGGGGNNAGQSGEQPPLEEEPNFSPELEEQLAADQVVANVNGEEILGQSYNDLFMLIQLEMLQYGQDVDSEEATEMVKQETIEILVGNKLLLQDAAEKGITVDEAKVEEELQLITSQFETEDELNAALTANDLTLEQLKEQVHEELILETYVREDVTAAEVTEEEIKQYYDEFVGVQEGAPSFEEIGDQLKGFLESEKEQVAVNERVKDLKEKSEIDILI